MSKSAENKSQIKKIKKIIKAKFRTDFVFYGLFFGLVSALSAEELEN